MIVRGIKQTLPGVYEITPDAGSAFFLRSEYLSLVTESELFIPYGSLETITFSDEKWADILEAALVYSVEVAAMSYLSRAEHCRFLLTQKLIKKNMEKSHIEKALDYLESVNYLSDFRFAGAWLRTRSIDHAEGRFRLQAELASRGVDSMSAKKALDEFFASRDELEICRRALKKTLLFKSDVDKIRSSLVRLGFSNKHISIVLSEISE